MKSLLGHMLWPALTRFVSDQTIGGNVGLIYTFHYVGVPVIPGVCQDLFLEPSSFSNVLDFVCRHMAPLEPADFLDRLEAGTLPPRAIMLTFDDGTRDAYTHALPELEKRGLKACFFVCPGLIEQRRNIPCLELMDICAGAAAGHHRIALEVRTALEMETLPLEIVIGDDASRKAAYHLLWPHVYRSVSSHHAALFASLRMQMKVLPGTPSYPLATWEQLDEMHRRGMWIANHTMSHSTRFADPPKRFAEEVAQAFETLDRRYPAPRRLFCYPYGSSRDVSSETSRLLEGLNTNVAFLTQGGSARPRRDGMLGLHREDATYSVGAAKLAPLLALAR